MSTFSYRRDLTSEELLPAVGAAVGAGVAVAFAVFYLARTRLQRTPLQPEVPVINAEPGPAPPPAGERPRMSRPR